MKSADTADDTTRATVPKKKKRRPKSAPVARVVDDAVDDAVDAMDEPEPAARTAIVAPVDEGRRLRNLAIQFAFIGVAAAAVYGFVRAAKNDHMRSICSATCAMRPAYAGRNRIAPDFTLLDTDGKSVSLSQFKGKTVVLNYWNSTCAPCMQEMPALARLAVALEGSSRVFITINTDAAEDEKAMREALVDALTQDPALDDKVKKYLDEGRFPFLVLRDPTKTVSEEKYGTVKVPETWIIDEAGFIRSRFDGPREWDSGSARKTIEAVGQGPGCLADFQKGKAVGPYAGLCEPE